MDRLRLWLAWVISALWVIQTVAARVPGLEYSPDARVDAAFGAVTLFLFGGAVVAKWRKNDDAKPDG